MDVHASGPLFDGRAEVELQRYCDDAEKDIADHAHEELGVAFAETFRHPTGYYESHVRVTSSMGHHEVTDGGVVYGPWLEGTGSRNFPKTRFKGYSNFRRVAAKVQGEALEIAERTFARYRGRIG